MDTTNDSGAGNGGSGSELSGSGDGPVASGDDGHPAHRSGGGMAWFGLQGVRGQLPDPPRCLRARRGGNELVSAETGATGTRRRAGRTDPLMNRRPPGGAAVRGRIIL